MANVDTAAQTNTEAVLPQLQEAGTQYDSTGESADDGAGDGMDKAPTAPVPSSVAVPAETDASPETLSAAPEHDDPTTGTTAGTTAATSTPDMPMPMDSSFTWGGYFQAVGTLLLLLALLWGLVWCVRKYGKFNFLPRPGSFPRDGLRVESQLPIGPRKSLMVVRFLNDRLLLGVTDTHITLLKETRSHTDEENAMEFEELIEKEQRREADT